MQGFNLGSSPTFSRFSVYGGKYRRQTNLEGLVYMFFVEHELFQKFMFHSFIYSALFSHSVALRLRDDVFDKNFFKTSSFVRLRMTSLLRLGVYALISTSTPLGRSSFESASTVRELDV